jgi:hypothetical protein
VTVCDEKVRKGQEIHSIQVKNPRYPCFEIRNDDDKVAYLFSSVQNSLLESIRLQLCPAANSKRAELYKLVIYSSGDHFTQDKDTIRDVNHFATLLLHVPMDYTGGEFYLAVRDDSNPDNMEVTIQFPADKLGFIAFLY